MCAADDATEGTARSGTVRSGTVRSGTVRSGTVRPDPAPGSVAEALRLAGASVDFLNAAAVSDLDGPGCGEALVGLSLLQARLAAARVRLLRRFGAGNGHDADGHGSASAWLTARAGLTRKAARSQVRQMRRLGERPHLEAAMAGAVLTESQQDEAGGFILTSPRELRAAPDA